MTTLSPFRFLPGLDDYLDALRTYLPGAEVPVLGDPGEPHEAVADISTAAMSRPVDQHGDVLVAWRTGSKAAEVGAALATCVGGSGVELTDPGDIGPASGDARYIVYIGLAEEIDERSLIRVHDSLWEHRSRGEGGHLGLVVGEDLDDLSWLIAKGLALPHRIRPAEEHVRIWPAVQKTPRRYGAGTWVLQEEARAERIRPLLLDSYTAAVSVIAHGRDDVVHFNDTVICPIGPIQIDVRSAAASHAPVCAFTGHCYRPEVSTEDVIKSGRIVADAVFTNSCMGMRVNEGLYPSDYLLPHGFVRGIAAAYLSTGQVINGLLKLNDVFHTACATGRSLGEAATLINDHLRYERVDLPYYSLLGLPWLTVAEAGDDNPWQDYLVVEGKDRADSGGIRAAAVALAAEEARGSSAHVIQVSPRGAAVLKGAVTEQLDEEQVPALKASLQAMGRAMTSLEDVPFTGLKYSRQGNMLVNVRDQVASVAASLHGAALTGDVARIRRRISAIATGVERAELTLAEAVFERGVQSFQHYNDIWGETLELHAPVLTDEECPYCERLLVQQGATHPIIERIGRDARVCPRCGMIRDADSRSPVSDMVVETAELWHVGESPTIRLRFRVAGDATKVAAGVFMANAAKNGMAFPPPKFVDLDAQGWGELAVRIDVPEEARKHQEYVRGLVVAEGTIALMTRPVWVRPGRGE